MAPTHTRNSQAAPEPAVSKATAGVNPAIASSVDRSTRPLAVAIPPVP